MEEIPKITHNQIAQHEEEIRRKIAQGAIAQWLDEQLKNLASENPILYQYVMEHTQKFAIGASMVQEPQAIAVSLALEQLLLLTLIGDSYKSNKEFKHFTDLMSKAFGNSGVKGLDALKDREEE